MTPSRGSRSDDLSTRGIERQRRRMTSDLGEDEIRRHTGHTLSPDLAAEPEGDGLADMRAAIEAELALISDKPRQFDAGAAAAYNFVLSLLPGRPLSETRTVNAALPTLSTTDAEGLRREIEALRVTPPYTGKTTINYNRAIDDVLALLAAASPTLPELP